MINNFDKKDWRQIDATPYNDLHVSANILLFIRVFSLLNNGLLALYK